MEILYGEKHLSAQELWGKGKSIVTDFNSLIAEFGKQVRENLRFGEGEPEAQLTNPVATLLKGFGALHSMEVQTVRETSLKTAGGGSSF